MTIILAQQNVKSRLQCHLVGPFILQNLGNNLRPQGSHACGDHHFNVRSSRRFRYQQPQLPSKLSSSSKPSMDLQNRPISAMDLQFFSTFKRPIGRKSSLPTSSRQSQGTVERLRKTPYGQVQALRKDLAEHRFSRWQMSTINHSGFGLQHQ